MDVIEPGGLGGTYGGSPIGCAAAEAVFDVILEEDLLTRADTIGDRLRHCIGAFIGHAGLVPIAGLRGLGAMVAFDIVDADGNLDGAEAKRVCARALAEGLIVLNCGQVGQAIRILVPLTASDAIIDEGLGALRRALAGVPNTSAGTGTIAA